MIKKNVFEYFESHPIRFHYRKESLIQIYNYTIWIQCVIGNMSVSKTEELLNQQMGVPFGLLGSRNLKRYFVHMKLVFPKNYHSNSFVNNYNSSRS